jgi:4-hydroxybenzoyl-CoA thioesterase
MASVYDRKVRFEEVDAAGIVFFARFLTYCHEAMEHLFDALPGGYVGLITERRVGFPAVHLQADWKTPLRYGDVVRIETSVITVGTTSATFRHVVTRDSAHVATIDHVVVSTDLDAMTKRTLPDDCRALLVGHRAPPAA